MSPLAGTLDRAEHHRSLRYAGDTSTNLTRQGFGVRRSWNPDRQRRRLSPEHGRGACLDAAGVRRSRCASGNPRHHLHGWNRHAGTDRTSSRYRDPGRGARGRGRRCNPTICVRRRCHRHRRSPHLLATGCPVLHQPGSRGLRCCVDWVCRRRFGSHGRRPRARRTRAPHVGIHRQRSVAGPWRNRGSRHPRLGRGCRYRRSRRYSGGSNICLSHLVPWSVEQKTRHWNKCGVRAHASRAHRAVHPDQRGRAARAPVPH